MRIFELKSEKGAVCDSLLRTLPQWFGIESAIQQYVKDIESMLTFVATEDGRPVGFLSLREHSEATCEIHVMAVHQDFHRQGVGRSLVTEAEVYLKKKGFEFLSVKTLSPSRACEEYERTRKFYLSIGFKVVEEFKTLWGDANPCLMLIKSMKA